METSQRRDSDRPAAPASDPARYRSIIEQAIDGVIVIDRDGLIIDWNRGAEAIFGWARDEVAGHALTESIIPPAYREAHAQGMQRFLDSRQPAVIGTRIETTALHRDGHEFPIDLAVLHIELDGTDAFAAFVRDITERRQAEQELGRLMTRIRLIMDAAGEGILGLDIEGRATFVNPAAARMTGYEIAELTGQPAAAILQHPHHNGGGATGGDQRPTAGASGDDPATPAAVMLAIQHGTVQRLADLVFWRRDGSPIPVECVVTPLRENGRVTGGVVIFRDISERQQLEAQLVQAQKLEGIGQLAAGIAHEINTPIQYVGDNLRFLNDAFNDLLALVAEQTKLLAAARTGAVPAEQIAAVEAAMETAGIDYLTDEVPQAFTQSLEGAERVAHIVLAMKEFSHPGGKEKSAVDLNRALESTLTVARNEWKYVAEAMTDFDAELPPVPCLPDEINQVFLNIIVNAAHAIGDVVGDGASGKGQIHISTRHLGDAAEIRIRDTGSGIPEESRAHVFEPFYTTKEVGRGTGQGLAISHSVVVEKHGGSLTFESEVGKGTTFVIRLPLRIESDQQPGVEP